MKSVPQMILLAACALAWIGNRPMGSRKSGGRDWLSARCDQCTRS